MSIYINNFFVKNYEKLDYIPIASTLKSTKELFEKYVALPFRNSQATSEHNYSYLNNKPLLRCITLLIPVIGNILVLCFGCNSLIPYQEFAIRPITRWGISYPFIW